MGRKKALVPTTYEKLPAEKSKNGYLYKLVARNKKVAVYEQTVEKDINGIPGKTVGYEVFLIQIGKAYSLIQKHGKKKGQVYHYPAAEKFPGDEGFGVGAWSFINKSTAMKKFEDLTNHLF